MGQAFSAHAMCPPSEEIHRQMPGTPPEYSTTMLNQQRKHAVLVSASLVNHDETRLISDYKIALEEAFSYPELVELILQSLLFDGYPCTLEGLITLKSISPHELPADQIVEEYTTENVQDWIQRGDELCRKIYGKNFEPLLDNVESLSPTLKEWMLYEGYGRVLARSALPIDVREMGIIAILVMKNLPRQLHSHMRGALRVGVSLPELDHAINLCTKYTSSINIKSAQNVLKKIS